MKKSVIKELRESISRLGNIKDPATGKVTLALSVSDRRHRATVQFMRGDSLSQVWQRVEVQLAQTAQHDWVRIESVHAIQKLERQQLEDALKAMPRMNYWRRGVSFDADFQTALLEMEINGHEFFKPGKDHKVGRSPSHSWIDFKQVDHYLKERNGELTVDPASVPNVWTFLTSGIFFDGQQIRVLDEAEPTRGIRQMTDLPVELKTFIGEGEQFLAHQIKSDGQFIYGYYPGLQRILSSYNSVRHFSSIYALLEAIAYTKDHAELDRAKKALVWGLDHLTLEQDGALFVLEHRKKGPDEIKLGAQAMLILALCKYQEVAHDETLLPYAQRAFAGVTKFLQPNGRFNHVLNTDLTVKDAFRIIYYEGEITFALTRLYEVTHDEAVATLVKQTLDFMVAHDYGKYHDHWISYAINEALRLYPDNRAYMQMGLQNVFDHLDFIEARDTAYPTLLELLNAAVKMTDTIKRTGNDDLLMPYDLGRLHQAWRNRARYELAIGSFQPELAMYFYYPEKFVGGFFARHDHFRTRIDDCEHFLSGLINYDTYTQQ